MKAGPVERQEHKPIEYIQERRGKEKLQAVGTDNSWEVLLPMGAEMES